MGKRMRVIGLLMSVALMTPVAVSAATAPIPDFSGIWGRHLLFFEPPDSGPGPVVSKLQGPGGFMSILGAQVGDDTNPILKPNAAEELDKRAAISLSGAAYPDPHNQCRPEPIPYALSVQFGVEMFQLKNEILILYLSNHEV